MTALQMNVLDRPLREARSTRPWLVVLLIAMCYIIATTDPGARTRWYSLDKGEVHRLADRLEQGRAQRQIGFLALGAVGTTLLIVRRADRKLRPTVIVMLAIAIYAAWASMSIYWSVERSLTFKRLIVFGCMASAIVAFARFYRPRDLALLAMVGSGIIMVMGLAFELFHLGSALGQWGYRFAGTMHPNHAGINAVILALASFYFWESEKKKRWLVVLGVAVVVLLLTKSRTSLAAGTVAMGLMCLLRWPIKRTLMVGLSLVAGNVLLFALFVAGLLPPIWSALLMGREDSDITTLTGRSDIWAAAISFVGSDTARWLTGAGYQSFWSASAASYVSARVQFHISEGHSAYLDSLLTLGVIGLACYVVALLASLVTWSIAARQRRNPSFAFLAGMLVFALIHGISESSTIDPNFATFITFTAMTMCAFYRPIRSGERQQHRSRSRSGRREALA